MRFFYLGFLRRGDLCVLEEENVQLRMDVPQLNTEVKKNQTIWFLHCDFPKQLLGMNSFKPISFRDSF